MIFNCISIIPKNKLKMKRLWFLIAAGFFQAVHVFGQGGIYPVSNEFCFNSSTSVRLTWAGEASYAVDRWEYSTNDGASWNNVTSNLTYFDETTNFTGTRRYRARINVGGGIYQYSNESRVTVFAASSQGSATFTSTAAQLCSGDNAGTIFLNSGFVGSVIGWASSNNNAAPWTDISNATNSLAYANVATPTYYKAIIKNGVCPQTLTTDAVFLDIAPVPNGGAVTISASSICFGTSANLTSSNTSGTLLTWQQSTGGSYTDISTGASYSTPTNLAANNYIYRLKATQTCRDATNATVSKLAYSEELNLTVATPTGITNPSGNNTVTNADPTVRSITAAPVNGNILRWELSADNSQWTPLSANGTTYNFNNLTQSTYYRVVTKNGACNEIASTVPVKITVAKGGTISASATDFCSPSTSGSMDVAGIESTSFLWESSVSPYTTWTPVGGSANFNTISFNALTQNTKYRVNVNSGLAFSNELLINVSSATVQGTLSTANSTVCPNDITSRTINLTGHTGGIVRWESSTTNGEPWIAIANITSSLSFNNLGESTYYRAVVKNGACTQISTAALQIVVAQGGTVSGSRSVCAFDGTSRSVTLTNHIGTVNNWEQSVYNTLTSTWGAFTNVGNAGATFFTYSNLTSSTRYRAVINSACASPVYSTVAEILVNDQTVGGTLSGAKTVRPNANTGSINLVGNNGAVVRWESSITNTAPWQTINITTSPLNYTNLAATTYFRAIVKNGECSETTSSNTILISVANGGSITGVAEVCSGDATTRTLSLFNQTGTISRWQSSTNSGVSWNDIAASSGATSLAINSLTQTTKFRAVITEDGGDIYSAEQQVNVNPLPVPDFSASTACLNAATTLTNTSSIIEGSILSNVWNFGDNTGSSITAPSHIYSSAGSYNIKLILTSAKLCKDSITKAVVVRPLPDVNFDFINVCDQNPVAFTNLSSLPGYTLTYAWGFGDSFTANTSDPTHTYASKGNYNVSLTVFANGTCAKSLTKTVTIFEKPQANFSFTNVCDGNAMKFVNTTNISTGNLTYLWNFSDGSNTSTLTNPEYTFSAPAIFNVTLTATSPFGCNNAISKSVQVFPNPLPNFNVANVCIGQSTTFNNTSTISSGTMFYNWDYKDGTNSNALSPTKTYAASGSYYAKLTVTSDRNCIQSIEKEVIIYQKPTVNFTYNNSCTNDTVNFNNTSAFFGGTVNYTWTFGDGSPTSSLVSPLKPYTSAGNYAVSLVGVSNSGCTDSKVQTVSVYANPVASFTNSASTCFGQSTTFTNNSSISTGTIASRIWDFGDGTTSNLLNPSRAFTQDGTYRVFLTVTSNRGCTDTTSKLITVSQKPTARFIQNDICKGSQMSFTNQSSGISGNSSFTWNFGDFIGTSSAQSPNYTYINPGAYKVVLTVSNLNGCTDSTSKLVNVFDAAVANFSKKDTCEGNVFSFTNLSTLNAGTMSYLWNFGNGTVSSNTEPAVIYSSNGTYNVQLTVTTDKGCQSNKNIPLNVYPNPIVLFNAQDVCYGLQTSFINNSQINSGAITYNWNFGDQSSSASTNPLKTYNGPGTYFVQLIATSDKGCKGATSKYIEVYPKPNADFTFNELCAGQSVNFSNISSIESGTMSYTWTLGNNQISNLVNPTTTYTNPTTYNVRLLTVSNRNCLDTTEKQITVYPLPVVGFANDTVCDGFPTTFKNTSTIPTGSLVYYQWDFGDLTNSLQENPIHQFLNGGNYNVSLLAESDKGCKQSLTKAVAVNNVPVANFTVDNACLGTPAAFVNRTTISSGTAGVLTYSWNFDDGNKNNIKDPTYVYLSSGTYYVTLKATISGGQCSDSTTKAITIYDLPKVSLIGDTTVSKGVSIYLNVSASEGNYTWSPLDGINNPLSSSVIIKPEKSEDYVFSVTDKRGCVASDTIKVTVNDDFNLVGIDNTLSNIITPDGNGKNDTWVIDNITSYPDNTVMIFNRWGQEVFKARNYQNNWGGTSKAGDQLPDGTYYFVVTFENSSVVHKGTLTILVNADKSGLTK